MKTSIVLKSLYLIICIIVIITLFKTSNDKIINKSVFEDSISVNVNSPTSLKLYELIEKYSTHYNIPKYIAYNIAYKETRYLGPFHWRYNPSQISNVGALGPMQIMPSTSLWINKKRYSKKHLMNNLELNVKTSMKLLNKLHKKYKNWSIVCGCYNTGKPIINEYARYCSSNKNYKNKWLNSHNF